ncbi:hypothetical protein BWI93_13505 [Siphonobacter sp. BAB-5385]|nr:hypothetical protein BWI93_13505 [Siphonobacter sp. BAB-5385]
MLANCLFYGRTLEELDLPQFGSKGFYGKATGTFENKTERSSNVWNQDRVFVFETFCRES